MHRTVLITGANRGIGFAIAKAMAEREDCHVLLASRDPEKGRAAARQLKGQVSPVTLDLGDRTLASNQIREIVKSHGPIDLLINNAGLLHEGSILDVSSSDFDMALTVNVLGPFDLARALVPGMIERGFGRVVNLSSGWGSFAEGLDGPAAYAMTKACLNALTVCLAQAVNGDVKVNAMCPGWVRTAMGGADATRSPEEGADTAVWLATLPSDGPNGGFFRDRQPIEW